MPKKSKPTIGFIGLGTMGGRMAASLRQAGHEMFVNDIRPEAVAPHVTAGAIAAETARDVGAATDVVFTSLPGPAEFTEVTLRAGVPPGYSEARVVLLARAGDKDSGGGEVQHRPERIWWTVTAVGLVTTAALWIYDRVLNISGASSDAKS